MSSVFDAAAPRYLQIADLMRDRIARAQWPLGHRLPSLEELATEFGVARVTLRQAAQILVNEGLLAAQQGRGTFVAALPAARHWIAMPTTLEELVRSYAEFNPQTQTLDEREAAAPLRAEDGIPADAYMRLIRVHSKDGKPYSLTHIYLDAALFKRHAKRLRREIVVPVLFGLSEGGIAHATQDITVGAANMEVARWLQLAVNSPLAEVRRVFTDAKGRVICLSETSYRGDFVRLRMQLK